MKTKFPGFDKNQLGFSLVELLVSMLIASIILSGVVQVALSGKRSAMDGEEISFIQDNARFVLDQIKRDTRAAGYMGCAGRDNTDLVNAVVDDQGGFISMIQGVEGFESDGGLSAYPDAYEADVIAGTDSFIVRFADATHEYKVRSHNAGSNRFTLWTAEEIPRGTTMMVTDSTCRSSGLFQVTSAGAVSNLLDHASDGTRNCTSVLKTGDPATQDCGSCSGAFCSGLAGQAFLNGASVMQYQAYAYYIGESDIIAGMPALKRRALSVDGGEATTIVEELALGVEDLEVSYGVDIDADGVANRFIDADDVVDWAEIVSMRISAVFRSAAEVYTENQNVVVNLDGTNVTLSDDKYLRQIVSTSVRLRNL